MNRRKFLAAAGLGIGALAVGTVVGTELNHKPPPPAISGKARLWSIRPRHNHPYLEDAEKVYVMNLVKIQNSTSHEFVRKIAYNYPDVNIIEIQIDEEVVTQLMYCKQHKNKKVWRGMYWNASWSSWAGESLRRGMWIHFDTLIV